MRTICVFTGSRSEYGLLKGLMAKIEKDSSLILKILVSGTHLSPEFGLTYREIEEDGFSIDERVITLVSADTATAICKSIGLGMISYCEALERLKPDILVILGDRFEALAAATAALTSKIPIAHIHGGESTIAAIDEAFRHAITKMSNIHFTSTEIYRHRVIQLGEDPSTVFNVGALGVENCKNLNLLSRVDIEKKIHHRLGRRNALITFHPETLGNNSPQNQFSQLLQALKQYNDLTSIFTKTNSDTEGRIINFMIDEYCRGNSENAIAVTSMGQLLYLSTMAEVDIVIGNSSSGIIEAPSLKTPTVNIGKRQQGRIKAKSVIDCDCEWKAIVSAIKKGLSIGKTCNESVYENPYELDETSAAIIRNLKSYNCQNIQKTFFDIAIG